MRRGLLEGLAALLGLVTAGIGGGLGKKFSEGHENGF
jgi:hypothetical protein